jgi:DNA-binding transcriptional regulator YdaS (Cro superfamily)
LADFITEHYGEITAQAVCGWKRCPSGRVLQVERATGGKVTRYKLRPDIFGEEAPRRKTRAAA